MSLFRFTPRAEADLDSMIEFIRPRNPAAGIRWLDRIEELGSLIVAMPEVGEARPDLGAGIRFFADGWYVIYYRPAPDGIEILRVLHGSRHVDRYTFDP